VIAQNVEQARRFAERIVKVPNVVLSAPVSLNVVCFRVAPPAMSPEQQDALNKELLLRIQETGLAIPSGSRIAGRYVLRVACSNHRSRWSDFEMLAQGIETLTAAMRG
jgi:glutamate/tyrosine decarboxylase-like PLP-dependent enzyme